MFRPIPNRENENDLNWITKKIKNSIVLVESKTSLENGWVNLEGNRENHFLDVFEQRHDKHRYLS